MDKQYRSNAAVAMVNIDKNCNDFYFGTKKLHLVIESNGFDGTY